MRYSLSSRFRGTLLGAVVGEMLAGRNVDNYPQPLSAPAWELIAASGAQSLIRLGRYDLADWQNMLLSVDAGIHNRFAAGLTVSIKAIIATIPISLFYHENQIKLRQNLQSFLVAVGQDNPVQDGALAVGYAIALALTEKLRKATLIPQVIAFIGFETQFTQQLVQVQALLEQGAGLERVRTCLSVDAGRPSTSIAFAFYCFLSTLEDLRLSVMRATQSDQAQNICAITGALSGAYNSTSGISTTLRALSGTYVKSLAAWGMKTEAEMLELSDSLVAVWSGVYEVTSPDELTSVAAIAAPNVIRL